jgi:tetratricopeptide (TPR) repeat protein
MSSAQTGEPTAGSPAGPSVGAASVGAASVGAASVGAASVGAASVGATVPLGDSSVTSSAGEASRLGGKNLAAWLAAGLAFIATLVTVPLIWTPISLQWYREALHAEWHIYLVVALVVTMPLCWLVGGWPRSWTGRCVFLLANLEILAIACLSALHLLQVAAVHVLVLGLRVAILSLWLYVLIGFPFVVWSVATRRRRPRQPIQPASAGIAWGKLWFSALILLLIAEPTAAVLPRVFDKHKLTFPASLPDPPPGELHVAFVGESTMAGFPYLKFGIPKVVGWQLEQMYPSRKIVLDDLSAVGLNLQTACARLDRLKVRPQLLLLYSGHNEFFYDVEELATDLETPWERFDELFAWSPLFRLLDRRIPRDVGSSRELEGALDRALVDRPVASADAREKRLVRFEKQLESLADWSDRQHIASLWFVPAGTEADYAPNRSYLDPSPNESARDDIESRSTAARALQHAGRWKEAAEKYEGALARCPGFAEFHFQLAESLAHDNRVQESIPHFAQALELDGHPVRMLQPWRQAVREVAGRHAIPLIDADAVLRPHTPHGLLDRSVFLDYVHPNLRSYYALGMAAVAQIREKNPFPPHEGEPRKPAHTDFAAAIAWAHFTASDLALAYRRTAEADRWMTRLRFESAGLKRDAQQYEDWRHKLETHEIAPGQAGAEALK